MSKFVITVATVAVATVAVALGAAACASKTPDISGTTPAIAVDQTVQVCAEAISTGITASATIKTKVAEATAAFTAGDQAKVLQIAMEVKTTANVWSAKLTELSGKYIKPEVKTVLTDGIATINTLAAATTPPPDAEAKLTAFATLLATACA